MCGIYGIVTADSSPVDAAPLAAMDRALIHRGPDDSGTLLDGSCALGMRRLSIIDVAGGHQPIANEDRSAWVVLNGEIYNHQLLRRQLVHRGHRFASAADTEVLVHLYEEQGPRFAEALRGMFACAVWDRRERRLVLVRDRLGIKPLYYAVTAGGLVFASELKALLVHPWVGRTVDQDALAHYLSFGVTPGDRAIIAGVSKLAPGHRLTYVDGAVTVERWWDLRPSPTPLRRFEDGVIEVRGLVEDAVRSHLMADVEVGAFLSGGVDSATVVALMVQAGARPRTFSIGWGEQDFDELRYARLVADHLGTRHEELVVRPDAWQLLDTLIGAIDEPLADVSAIPTFLVSQLAARHVKVVLSGDGGDEVFGGYERYVQALTEVRRLDGVARRWPRLRQLVGTLAAHLPEPTPGKYWLRHVALDPMLRYVDGESLWASEARRHLLRRAAGAWPLPDPILGRARLLADAPGGDPLARLLYLDTMTYLPLDILTKVDRMSMAHSLEVRPPLLDTPLVEAVAAMPSAWKVVGREQKRLLKQAARGLVPGSILRRPKRGFGVPIRRWFRGALRDAPRAILTDRRTRERGLLDPAVIESLLREHASGRRDQSVRIWSLLVLELWLRTHIDPPRDSSGSRPLPSLEEVSRAL